MTEGSVSRPDATHSTSQGNGARLRVRRVYVIALIIGLAGFALYAATAAPWVATLFDDLEFQVVLPRRSASPTPAATRSTRSSANCSPCCSPFAMPLAALTCCRRSTTGAALGVLYLLAQKVAGNRAATATATALFALSPAWWSQATIAEVYTLHGLFVVLFLYLLLRWEEIRSQETGVRRRGQGSASSFQLPVTAGWPPRRCTSSVWA